LTVGADVALHEKPAGGEIIRYFLSIVRSLRC
jgi:hypothetical protein